MTRYNINSGEGNLLFLFTTITNPNQLYEDMEKLDALYEQLGWNHTDTLTFAVDGDKIVVRNLFQEQRNRDITVTDIHPFE